MSLSEIKPGDIVIRDSPSGVVRALLVTRVAMDVLYASAGGWDGEYEFVRSTGGEVDMELGWDGVVCVGPAIVHVVSCPASRPYTFADLGQRPRPLITLTCLSARPARITGRLMFPPRVGGIVLVASTRARRRSYGYFDSVTGIRGDIEVESVVYVQTQWALYRLERSHSVASDDAI
jgi:hypothetical protein